MLHFFTYFYCKKSYYWYNTNVKTIREDTEDGKESRNISKWW